MGNSITKKEYGREHVLKYQHKTIESFIFESYKKIRNLSNKEYKARTEITTIKKGCEKKWIVRYVKLNPYSLNFISLGDMEI